MSEKVCFIDVGYIRQRFERWHEQHYVKKAVRKAGKDFYTDSEVQARFEGFLGAIEDDNRDMGYRVIRKDEE